MYYLKKILRNSLQNNIGEKVEKFPVFSKEENILIGHIAFFKYFGNHTYEIGWVFHPDFHNKGYASEAARAVLEYAFTKMKIHRIIATCQPENISSFRVMEKIGMRREGNGNDWWDEYYYAILKDEWGEGKRI